MIQREVGDPIALALLEGEYRDGDTVVVDAAPDGSLTFSSAAANEHPSLDLSRCGGSD